MNRQFITEFWIDDEDYPKDVERLRELNINPIEEHDSEIRKDERAKTIEEIGNECSDKDLNENIDWCIQTLSLFDVTDLNKKELCETLETQKAMIVMHNEQIRADERQKFVSFMAEHTSCRTDCENILNCDGKKCWNKYLDMYEKEKKNE